MAKVHANNTRRVSGFHQLFTQRPSKSEKYTCVALRYMASSHLCVLVVDLIIRSHRSLRTHHFVVLLFRSSQGNMERINAWAGSLKDILWQMNTQMQVRWRCSGDKPCGALFLSVMEQCICTHGNTWCLSIAS